MDARSLLWPPATSARKPAMASAIEGRRLAGIAPIAASALVAIKGGHNAPLAFAQVALGRPHSQRCEAIGSPVGSQPLNTAAKNASLSAPRAGVEPATYCLGGTSATSPDVAGCRLMCCLAAPIIAGRGLASPGICLCWLPVWLPRDLVSLAHVWRLRPPLSSPATAGTGSPITLHDRKCSGRTRAGPRRQPRLRPDFVHGDHAGRSARPSSSA